MTVPYLSRIWLNPLRVGGRRLLGDPQALHAAVLGGLPVQPVRGRVLWRLEANNPRRPGVIVLTPDRPSWEHLTEQAGWPSADDPADPQVVVRNYQPLLDRLKSGQRYVFRLVANPTQSTKRPDQPTPDQRRRAEDGTRARSVRLGHRSIEHQIGWFTRRAAGWGFVIPDARSSEAMSQPVPDLRIIGRQRLSFKRAAAPGQVVVQAVTYEGQLEVADAELMRTALVQGIGPAKAYGCGLLTLAPLSNGSADVVEG